MIGNLLIRMYGRIWDERLRKEINTFERQKGLYLSMAVLKMSTFSKVLVAIKESERRPTK